MSKFNFIKTEDGSIGLYSNEINDIFHSKTGAMTEAFDKFIKPSFILDLICKKNSLKILDICYGIGYNSKAALSVIPKDYKLTIDCLEYSKEYIQLSPFIFDSLNRIDINLFLFSKINYDSYDFGILSKFSEYLDVNMLSFIKFIHKIGYIYDPQVNNNSFLHNIYYNYMTNSMKAY